MPSAPYWKIEECKSARVQESERGPSEERSLDSRWSLGTGTLRRVPSMRRPVSVKYVFSFFPFPVRMFLFFSFSCEFLPVSQAAPVATLPSALFVERWSLGASWVYSIH